MTCSRRDSKGRRVVAKIGDTGDERLTIDASEGGGQRSALPTLYDSPSTPMSNLPRRASLMSAEDLERNWLLSRSEREFFSFVKTD